MEYSIQKYEPFFGSWYITKKLDQGASSQLFQIHKTDAVGNDSYSALKVIPIPAGGETELKSVMASGVSREELKQYYQGVISSASSEFTILSRLKGNTNIVNYEDHEIIQHEDSFGWDILIRMEQITPFLEYTMDHELTEDEVLKMGIDICHGLVLCAKHKIIHRDIKPENIFVSDTGDFKIGDFGIARIVEQTQTFLSRKGTFTFMAPEMFRGDPYTENVDLYSLGLVMYRYLNHGRDPFMPAYPKPISYGNNEKAFAERMSGYNIPRPANGSRRLKEIVLKACAHDSSERYATASEMLEDLEALREKGREAQRQEKLLASLPRYRRALYRLVKRRKKLIAALALLLILCAGAVFAAYSRDVTFIDGIEANTKMLYEDTLSPDYTVHPFWFSDSDISFSSSDEDVFTVNEDGKLTAVGPGNAVLTMKARSYTGYAQIHVDPKVTKISNVSDLELYTGDSKTLKPKLKPKKYADEKITYSTADKSVATVSSNGKVTAKSAGGTVITISAGGTVKKVNVIVMTQPTAPAYNSSGSSSYSNSGSSNSSGSSSKSGSSNSSSGSSSKSGSSSNPQKGDYFDDEEYF